MLRTRIVVLRAKGSSTESSIVCTLYLSEGKLQLMYELDYLGFELESKVLVGKGHLLKEEKLNMWLTQSMLTQ